MAYRNLETMRRNALGALPGAQETLSLSHIYHRQERPRLPPKELRILCESMADAGELERIGIGPRTYYRRITPPVRALAIHRESSYTPHRGSGSFPVSTEVLWFRSTLFPLRHGKTVFLWMDAPRWAPKKKYTGNAARKLVVLVPGPVMRMKADTVLVSVIGSGSCVIRTCLTPEDRGDGDWQKRQRANLALAGMPTALADLLISELNQVFKE